MISYISLIFYMIAFVHIMLFLLWGNRNVRNLFNIFMGIGLLFNIADMALRYFNTGAAPTSTLYDVMNMVCISFGITYFILYAALDCVAASHCSYMFSTKCKPVLIL